MIRYTLTQQLWTEEDLEIGEPSYSGPVFDSDEYDSFRCMVRVLDYAEPSEYPPTPHKGLWFSVTNEPDPLTGEIEVLSYHPLTERDARYMLKAWKATHRS
jgi:hypothetical protein